MNKNNIFLISTSSPSHRAQETSQKKPEQRSVAKEKYAFSN